MTATQTAAPRQRKPRPKPVRSIKLLAAPSALMAGVVQITVDRRTVDYFVDRVASDFGAAFRLIKILGPGGAYHVCLDGLDSLCDCKGFHSAKSGRCKHIDGLQALVNAGRI